MTCPFDIVNDIEKPTEDSITSEEWQEIEHDACYAPNRFAELYVLQHNLRHVSDYMQEVFVEWPLNIGDSIEQ